MFGTVEIVGTLVGRVAGMLVPPVGCGIGSGGGKLAPLELGALPTGGARFVGATGVNRCGNRWGGIVTLPSDCTSSDPGVPTLTGIGFGFVGIG